MVALLEAKSLMKQRGIVHNQKGIIGSKKLW